MTVEIVWRPQAREDLLEIYAFIAPTNPTAANHAYNRIRAKVSRLAAQPRIGPRRPDIRSSVGILIDRPYLILYEIHPDTDHGPIAAVEIVRVVHGRRDLRRLS